MQPHPRANPKPNEYKHFWIPCWNVVPVLPVHLEDSCRAACSSIELRGESVGNLKSKGYRVVAVSLYQDEAAEADRLTEILRGAGWARANRSLVIREALACLTLELRDKSPEDVFRYFLEHFARRAASPRKAASPSGPEAEKDHNTKP